MAMPIAQTPVLDEKEYAQFWDQVRNEENDKVSLVSTPNLDELREKIVADAKRRAK